jgi:hypothetical protein
LCRIERIYTLRILLGGQLLIRIAVWIAIAAAGRRLIRRWIAVAATGPR